MRFTRDLSKPRAGLQAFANDHLRGVDHEAS
jgi:hypothetical protein